MRALLATALFALSACAQTDKSSILERHFEAQKTGICQRHHIHMERRLVAVTYGLPMRDDAYVAAMGDFPNAEANVNGGCDPSAGPRKASIYVCPECKRAQLQWAQRHPKNSEAEIILRERRG